MSQCNRVSSEVAGDPLEDGSSFTATALRIARERFGRGAVPTVYAWGPKGKGRGMYVGEKGVVSDAVIEELLQKALDDDASAMAVMCPATRRMDGWVRSSRGKWALVLVEQGGGSDLEVYCAECHSEDGGPLGPWFAVCLAPLH